MAKNRALASAQKAYQKGRKVREQKPTKKKKQREERAVKPKTPSRDVSSQYESYKKSSFAPKTTKTKKQTNLAKAQSAFKAGQNARVTQQKRGVTNTSVPKTSGNITDSFKTSKKDLQKAYKKGSQTTYLGTKQTETTTTLKTKKQQKQEYKQSKKSYYKSQDWKNTKNELKTKNKEGWRKALSDAGWSRAEIDAWMNSEEGKKNRGETYMEAKNATKKSINKSIAKGIKDTSKLKSVNALTKGEFDTMVTANSMGKKRGNKYLETSTKRFGTKDIREKIGSKTAESAYKSKLATGVMQGMSKGDVFSGSVGKYNKGAKEAIKQTKESGAYLAGYGIGLAADMGMGGVASRGASVAEMVGKSAAKEVPKKALKEATEEIAKVSAKDGAKRFAKNRVGELVAESPTNVLDAVKMSLDTDGNLDKNEFKKWLAMNSALTFGVGGAIEGIGAGATKKLASNTEALIAKREAGTITADELKQLDKNIKKLSQKAKGNYQSISSDIADARMKGFNAKDAKKKASVTDNRISGFGVNKSRGQGTYTSRQKHASYLKENEQRLVNRAERAEGKQKAKVHEAGVNKVVETARENRVADLSERMKALTNRENELLKKVKSDNTMQGHAKAVAELEEVQKALKVTKNQLDRARSETFSGKVANNLREQRKNNTMGGHEKAVREGEALKAEGKARADKAFEEAKEVFEKNPTPENRARMEMAENAVERVERGNVPSDAKSTPSNPSPETKKLGRAKDKAEKQYNDIKASYDKWDNQGGKIYNNMQAAYRSGNKEYGDDLMREWQSIQDQKAMLKPDLDKAEQRFTLAKKAYEDSMSYNAVDDMPIANARKVDDTVKASEEEVGIIHTAKRFEDGRINAEAKTKRPVQKLREALVTNEASLEDIAEQLPDALRKEMLASINEFRRAVKTGRAMVAERGRSIYSKYGLTKRGTEARAKRVDFERYAVLTHELDRKKAGNNFLDLSRDQIYKEMRELELKYATNVDKDGVLVDEAGRILKGDVEISAKDLKSEIKDFQIDTRNYYRKLLGMEVDAGITTAEEAKAFMKKYPNYVPTYRVSEFDEMMERRTMDEIDVGRGIKSATGGSDKELVPLYNQMQVKTNAVVKRVQLNKMLKVLTYASGTTEKELDDMLPWFKNMDSEGKAEALLDSQVFTKSTKGKNIAIMYHKGARVEISIDKEVYDCIRRWSGEDRKWVALSKLIDNGALRFANTNFKKWITDYNLIFGVKNLKRDMATALFYTNDVKGFVKNMPKGFAVAMLPDKMLTKDMKIYKEAYQVYKENGGVISQFIARDSASDAFLDTANKLNPFKYVENFNSAMETIPRMTEFISALDSKALKMAGKDGNYDEAFRKLLKNKDEVADAMYRAKDVTLNFDRSGWLGAKLNRGLVPFFNPAIQGISKLGRKTITDNIKYGKDFKVNPTETMTSFLKMGAYLGGMVAMPAMAWNSLFGDYINGEKDGYEKQSDYNRYSNYLLPIGDGKFVKIPKARELSTLQATLDWAYDNMKYGDGTKWEKLFSDKSERDLRSMLGVAYEQTGALTPWGDSLFMPIYNNLHNKTWYGGKIESGADDLRHREEGELYKIWDEKTSATAKWIGKKFNMSPKKVDHILDSYLGVIYDMGISQTSAKNDFRQVWKEEGAFKGLAQLTRTPWGNAFIVDSVFSNANKSDYYDYVDKRNAKLKKLKEGSDEYLEVKSEITKDKTAFSYTSSQYDELQAQIWLDKNLTMKEKQKYVRMLKKGDNSLWNDRKDGKTAPSKDPMAVAWNMKKDNGKRVMSTDKIIESCSYTFKNGGNTIGDAWTTYKKNEGYSAEKFMNVTLSARDVQRSAGDSLSTPRWEVVAYSSQLNHIKGSDKVVASYIEKESKRTRLLGNAKLYEEYGGDLKTYKTMRRALTQGTFDLGYEYVGSKDIPDGVTTMILANARTKKGGKYRDLAYQANDFYIMQRMNSARCLDHKKNGHHTAKEVDDLCKKYKLKPNDDYTWDTDKVVSAINKDYPNASNEVKASLFQVITGLTKSNPFGAIGDYSLSNDTGVYCEGGYGGYGRRGRRRGHWGHGGGGRRGKTFKPVVNTAGSNSKVTNTSKTNTSSKSNLDDSYRKKLKKLREETRSVK